MAKVKDNIVTEGLSGKLGKRLVARHMRDGRTIIATRPNYTGTSGLQGRAATTAASSGRPPTPAWHRKPTLFTRN
jgi:hypothetical protein